MFGFIGLPVMWRGIAFRFGTYTVTGGRRVAVHEFPTRDSSSTEDLGRRIRHYSLRGHVIGPAWESSRDALIRAAENSDEPGTLIHPYLGPLRVRCMAFEVTEDSQAGQMANFSFQFIEAGDDPGPSSIIDTVLGVLGAVSDLLVEVGSWFSFAMALTGVPAALVAEFQGWLAGLTAGLTALGFGQTFETGSLMPGMVGAPADAAATAAAIVAVMDARAADLAAGSVPIAGDRSGGLAGLAGWGADILGMVSDGTPTKALQASNAQAFVDLVRGVAVAETAAVYAVTAWPSANAAAAACAQLRGLIDDRAAAAARAGQDNLFAAWRRVASAAYDDLTTRAQRLPDLVSYGLPGPWPSLALAYRLYQDATRADQIVALNDVPHPLFMPRSGVALSA